MGFRWDGALVSIGDEGSFTSVPVEETVVHQTEHGMFRRDSADLKLIGDFPFGRDLIVRRPKASLYLRDNIILNLRV
nr:MULTISPECIES: hypothetical protein [unclassified Cohnella]